MRRFHYESWSLYMASIRRKTERQPEDVPSKLEVHELEARRKRFLDTHATGDHYWVEEREPSDDLCNLFHGTLEARILERLPWDERTTLEFQREHAPRPSKRRRLSEFQTDERGYFKLAAAEEAVANPLHAGQSEFQMKWDRMMDRSGIAAEIGHVMSFAAHDSIKRHL